MTLGSTQLLTEMSARNFLRGERWPVRKAEKLTAMCEAIVWKMWEPGLLTILWASTASSKG
jgi:hypothetical protein